ncbi:hypothetical protein BXZ70DRAFT_1066536 [Cristinia sonorae]|uniref:MYND-type domain-containing protein n=1 Tax=Cristinia sonorae TaxID=1940300 RepID=A0A8K0UK95_9AGAR|nr:hypothetical protein BXZ70DRAFT_1066536 [Cristinia sonorae]
MSLPDFNRIRPNKHTHRSSWNESWEKDLKVYDTFRRLGTPIIRSPKSAILASHIRDLKDSDLDVMRGEILQLQSDIRENALALLVVNGFAQQWADLSSAKRTEHVLEALFKASIAGPDLEGYRRWCPDMTVGALGRQPSHYPKLLKEVVDVEGQMLKTFPHPAVEALWSASADDHNAVLIQRWKLGRTYFVSMVVWRVLLSFYGGDEGVRVVMTGTERSDRERSRQLVSLTEDTEEKRLIARIKHARLVRDAEEGKTCWGCGTREDSLPSGRTLQACSGCKKANQRVFYCSRECQKRDWKLGVGGDPPHKETCAKILGGKDFRTAVPSVAPHAYVSKMIPQSDPGFRRSLELQHQIRLLTMKADVHPDYLLSVDYPDPDIGLIFPDVELATQFICARTRAFRSGDPGAVYILYTLLDMWFSNFTPSTGKFNLRKQLESEFGLDMDEAANYICEEPTEAELKEASEIALLSNRKLALV